MASKKQEAASAVLDAMKVLAEEAKPKKIDDGRMNKLNADGGMLMCELVIQKRVGAPDPLCMTVNEEIKWAKRGAKVVVPWYFVAMLKSNVERKFRQEKDPNTGKNIVVWDDVPGEPFSYMPINPAPGVEV